MHFFLRRVYKGTCPLAVGGCSHICLTCGGNLVNLKPHVRNALAYFVMAAVLGVVLRSFQVLEISITYKFFVHTHSHIALLGWVYLALTTLIYKLFVQSPVKDIKYRRIFWFTQLTLIGMLLTFPFQGYALFSIVFSTLFLFASYWFFWFFTKHAKREFKKNNSYRCIKMALWLMVISSLGPWALGAIMNTLGAESIWYRMAIYFYLHFQYNGWMILALIGMFFYIAEQQQYIISDKTFERFMWIFNLGVLLSFFLSTLFTHPPILLNFLGGLGALLQLIAFGILIKAFTAKKHNSGVYFTSFQNGLLRTVIILWGIKMILQLISASTYLANLAATVLDFTIAYLHWTFLGVVTIGIFFFLDYFQMLKIPKKGYWLYLAGFVITEALIFYKGIAQWWNFLIFEPYFEVLVIGSMLIPLSLVYLFAVNLLPRYRG